MQVIPAIDLFDGCVVRLARGDLNNKKIYSDDPLGIAMQWQALGAKTLHVVDLSAAFDKGDNIAHVKRIVEALSLDVQVGGGIRDLKKAERLFSMGVKRLIIGTRSVDEEFLGSLIKEFGADSIAVGVDVRAGRVALRGWQEQSSLHYLEFIAHLQEKGVKWVIYTDISRDGMLSGLDTKDLLKLSVFKKINFIVSGGVASLEDIQAVSKELAFVWGMILGKSLYEGAIDLKDALSLARNI